ncbi:hypothetical protein CPAR01_12901 [Colletotrichum paranaense]|uniref:Uncharacterized protein n=1 Tax=Colletotrichum paranaense TaxID=1914294 RepID=A0ABQ9S7R2_9PEZI|nr:uncharacterized protein CPAR01_12901 [Colletotrichum paranaense]KAK1528343.1 hypothetical protein CPAR01_12901 [Colletotrichum paranaense]
MQLCVEGFLKFWFCSFGSIWKPELRERLQGLQFVLVIPCSVHV